MSFLNRIFSILLSIILFSYPAFAMPDIDMSVDSDIRKKYNPNKIENDFLTPLPDNLKYDIPLKTNEEFIIRQNQNGTVNNNANINNNQNTAKYGSVNRNTNQNGTTSNYGIGLKEVNLQKYSKNKISLKKGTKFTVRTTSSLSDRMPAGSKVSFKLAKPIKTTYFLIPENTGFSGIITDSHTPQLSGNGGLLVIRIDNITINGRTQEINAKVTKVNYKKVFFNNIKGKRTYLKGLEKSIKPGKKFYDRTWATTKKLAASSSTLIFSPFTLAAGILVLGVNVAGSPVFAIFSKGGNITIPANSPFEIKLNEDITIYN